MTLGTWWKSKESTQKYQEQMTKNKDKWQSDVVNSRLHYQLVIRFLVEQTLPQFSQMKFDAFYENLQTYSVNQVSNCNKQLNIYDKVSSLNKELLHLNETMWKEKEKEPGFRLYQYDSNFEIVDDTVR